MNQPKDSRSPTNSEEFGPRVTGDLEKAETEGEHVVAYKKDDIRLRTKFSAGAGRSRR